MPAPTPLASIAARLAMIAVPFVPTILWYTGGLDLTDMANERLSMVEAIYMEARHRSENHLGMPLFLLPSALALASFAADLRPQARRMAAIASLLIALFELTLIWVPAAHGTPYDAVASFFGIQAMIPADRLLTHAATLALAAAAWLTTEALRPAAPTA